MRIGTGIALIGALIVLSAACGGGGLFRQYEYEEDVYLSLDGTATVYVNSSVPALNALRGTGFDASPDQSVDRDAVRDYFTAPGTHVTRRVTTSRRGGRRFVHVRVDVDDVRRMGEAPAFSWSTYRFTKDGNLFIYGQTVGAAAGKDPGGTRWTGEDLVAFRLHLPSRIVYHNAGEGNPRRGNILAWEQPILDRLRSVPLVAEARIESESILYRTLWLFGATIVAVAVMFGLVIWWVFRRGVLAAPA